MVIILIYIGDYLCNRFVLETILYLQSKPVSLLAAMGKEIEKVAKAEHRIVSELIREASRNNSANWLKVLIERMDNKETILHICRWSAR